MLTLSAKRPNRLYCTDIVLVGCGGPISDTIVIRNHASEGGGLSFCDGPITNCIVSDNTARAWAGGLQHCNGKVSNCIITGNGRYGLFGCDGSISNCTIVGNIGSGLFACRGSITNCIIWDNSVVQIEHYAQTTYSDIKGGLPGQGNIDAVPCFVQPGYWDPNDTLNDPWDDVWIEGDYHLLPDSPCINAGDPNHLYDSNDLDLDGKPRVIGCRIDMGAFEYRHLVPAEVRIVPHTINLANRGKWITAYLQLPEEYNISETDFCILLLEDKIEPEQLFINEKEQIMMFSFNHEQLQAILNTGDLELKISVQLTDATVFEGTDVIKVIYEGGGKLAKLSGKASNPNPADGATGVFANADLSWTAGFNATSHDVYFGTDNPPPFIGNQTATSFDTAMMAFETTYYWRIDEVNKWSKTAGDLWIFKTNGPPPPPPPPPPPW